MSPRTDVFLDRRRLQHGDVFSTVAARDDHYAVIRSDTRSSYNSVWLQIDHLHNGNAFMLNLRDGGVYESKHPGMPELWNVGGHVVLVGSQLVMDPLRGMDYSQDIVPELAKRLQPRLERSYADNAGLDVENYMRLLRGPSAYLYFDLLNAFLNLVEANDLTK